MQSVHAGTCLLRVGPCRRGSMLGTILDPFWGPGSLLSSLVGARWAETGPLKSYLKTISHKIDSTWYPQSTTSLMFEASFVASWWPLGPQEVPRSPQGAPQDTFFTILGRRCTYFPAVVQNVRKKVKENTDAPSFDGRQTKKW